MQIKAKKLVPISSRFNIGRVKPSWVTKKPSDSKAWDFQLSYVIIRLQLSRALDFFDLQAAGFTLHSLRYGGATIDHLRSKPIAYFKKKGNVRASACASEI